MKRKAQTSQIGNNKKQTNHPPQNNVEPIRMFLPSGKCREREKFWKYQA